MGASVFHPPYFSANGWHESRPNWALVSADDTERMRDLSAIYRQHHAFVWRSLYGFGLRGDEIRDAVQEVFVVVHRKFATFDGRSAIRHWLYGIARRVAADHRKKGSRRSRRLHLVPDNDATPDAPRTDESLTAARLVEQFLSLLDDDKRQVFLLAEVEGMTVPEIATALGVNLNTIYTRLRAARLRFRKEVERLEAVAQKSRAWTR